MKKYLHPLYLLALAFMTYGLFFWQRGFYWDESPWTWIYFRLGPDVLTQTFSTSRPFWGMIYQVMLPLIGPYPARWQFLVIIIHWLAAVQVWWLIRQLWPQQGRLAFVTAALFLVYPGLGQNYLGLMYTHFYIVLNALLLSFNLSLLAMERPRQQIPLTLAAMFFAFINLLTMEYFYFLEMARPVLFWIRLRGEEKRVQKSALRFVPYFLVLFGITFWRAFFFESQNASYSFSLLANLRENPLAAIWRLITDVLFSLWVTVPQAWTSVFVPVDMSVLGPRTLAVVLLIFVLAGGSFGWMLARRGEPATGESDAKRERMEWFGLGLVLWLFAGVSFWIVGLVPLLNFSEDRFTLPFILASSLIVAGLIELLEKWPRLQIAALALLIGLSAARHQQFDAAFRHDWEVQRGLFNQMSWRIPGLEEGTILLSNDLPVRYSSDNSLTGPLNWMYSPAGEMNAILYFASIRVGTSLPDITPGISHEKDYRGPIFHGNTSNILVINFEPPGCLRVIDPQVDADNRLLSEAVRDVASYSNSAVIHFEQEAVRPVQLYGSEPAHGWCYYFEKADLARQMGDWDQVAELGEAAFALDDHPNDPIERFVFIEGYAHVGQWERAKELSLDSYRVSRNYVGPLLCTLWNRIDRETQNSLEKALAVEEIRMKADCSP
ncbi:MAG: hypothetical protein AB1649_07015 [Chloroflexota bacterium]